jgi:hypothetical protein
MHWKTDCINQTLWSFLFFALFLSFSGTGSAHDSPARRFVHAVFVP